MFFRNSLLFFALLLVGQLVGQRAGQTYYIQSQVGNKTLVLGAQGGTEAQATEIATTQPRKLPSQRFTLEDAGGGYYYLRSSKGLYVHLHAVAYQVKSLVHYWPGKGRDNTKWKFVPAGNGTYLMQSKTGSWLDVPWVSDKPQTAVWMWTRHGRVNQQWRLVPVNSTGKPSGAKMTRFDVEKHGFNFSNRFDNWGNHMGFDINFSGLCGGMSYAALDYYHAGKPVPSNTSTPTEGNQLTNYIRGRQWSTYENQGDKWAELFVNPFGWRTKEFFNWGIQGYNGGRLEELCKRIDAGQPVPLGLFAAGDGGFTSRHHQVVAIGYNLNGYTGRFGTNADRVEIYIYDPNYPNTKKTLVPKPGKLRYAYKNGGKEWLTYFVDMRYRAARPLDPSVSNRCSGKNLTRSNQAGKNLSRQSFRCLKGDYMNARGATIHGSDFFDAQLKEAVFYGADCQGSTFELAKIPKGDFEGANLYNTLFRNASLKGARFYGADMRLAKADQASFDGANMEGANLHKGSFKRATFRNTRLYGTNLNSANLSGADFSGANLDGADLRGANLNNANFSGAKITQHTKCDPGAQRIVRNWPGVRPR